MKLLNLFWNFVGISILFCRSCIALHSLRQCTGVPLPPYPPQHSFFAVWWRPFWHCHWRRMYPPHLLRGHWDNKQLLTQADLSPRNNFWGTHPSKGTLQIRKPRLRAGNQKAPVSGLSNPNPDFHLTTEKDPSGYNAQNLSPLRGSVRTQHHQS